MKGKRMTLFLALITLFLLLAGCGKESGNLPATTDPGSEFLPIGSIVSVRGTSDKIMILGYAAVQLDTEEFVQWDYSGTLYPQGVLDPEELYLINHNMITSVIHLGYKDSEFNDFLPLIHEAIEEKKITHSL